MRIDRILSETGYGTRKEVAKLLKEGRVRHHATVVTQAKYTLDEDEAIHLSVDGVLITPRRFMHYLLHKPVGYLSATEDRHSPVALDLLPEACRTRKLSPVGRLDKDSSGLLFFTNDGQLNYALTSPKHRVGKRYRVEIEPLMTSDPSRTPRIALTAQDQEIFASGTLELDGSPLKPAELTILGSLTAEATLYEGKYRQLRRMFELIGFKVVRLCRISEASLSIQDLEEGEARPLTDKEVSTLYAHVGLVDPDAAWREAAPQ